jgi:DNA-binding NtrC family response regulator
MSPLPPVFEANESSAENRLSFLRHDCPQTHRKLDFCARLASNWRQMSPSPVSSDRFTALLGDEVAKKFADRVCDAPDDPRELTPTEQGTVVSFFSLLGADFENSASDERELDHGLLLLLLIWRIPLVASDPSVQKVRRILGIGDIAPAGDDDAGPWRLWDSAHGAARFVHRCLKPMAALFNVKLDPDGLADRVFSLPERFRRHIQDTALRLGSGEITGDAHRFRIFLRFEYLRLLMVGWEGFAAQRKAMLAIVPRLFLPQTIRTKWDEVELGMAPVVREHMAELWAPPPRRWVRLHHAIRWLIEEHWPKRAPVLNEIGDASAQIKFRLVQAALGDATVLIVGEPGTGKDLAAQAIHQLRHGEHAPYRAVNCGAVSHELIRSELFGHEKGAFTGADKPRAGVFAEAKGGTVFLDEIGEMPLDAQPSLLRALATGKAARLGSDQEMDLKADVVAATNRNLRALIAEKQFRPDLFDRLNGQAAICLPPLSERDPDDIAAIWNRLLAKAAKRAGVEPPGGAISRFEAMQLAQRGRESNVRTLDRLSALYVRWNPGPVTMGIEEFLARVDLSDGQGSAAQRPWPDYVNVAAARAAVPQAGDLEVVLKQLEEAVIADALTECNGSYADAARRLGWKPDRLQKRKQRSDSNQT